MKKFFSLVLALVMALSLTTVAWGADVTFTVDSSNPVSATNFHTLQDAVDAAAAGNTTTIKLLENVTLTSRVTVSEELILDLGAFTITAAINDTYGAVYVGMAGNLTINATTGGITNTAGHAIGNYGVVTINGGTFTGDYALYNFYYNTTTFGTATINGGTFQASSGTLAVANCGDLTVAGGSVESLDSSAVLDVTGGTIEELAVTEPDYAPPVTETTISDGTVESLTVEAAVEDSIAISGGSFGEDVSPYLASTAGFVTNPDGSVTVGAKATTGTYDLYSCNNTAVAAATGLSYTKVAAAPKTDGTGTIAYVAVDNGKNYMEISSFEATKADFYVTVSGSKTAVMYLREVSTVSYVASAKEFTNFGYGCGQYTKAYGDTSKYYQVLDGAYKNRVFRAETTGLGFLVDGKIVQLATEVTLNAHTWSATAVDTVTGVPTKAICGKCSTTGTVYASAAKVPAAAVIDVTALSYNGVSYPVVAGYKTVAGPVTGTTDKVESAATFDAGIAMYVGMSVMAAAGSAVVIGKKKD